MPLIVFIHSLSTGVFQPMVRYEALMLTVPEITADESKAIEQQFGKLVAKNKGSVLSFERWGKYRLSYPVKKNDYGVYFLARFEAPESNPLISEVKNFLAVALHEVVMRNEIVKLDLNKSLEYQRPPSLEDTPAREVGSFLKEGRVEALLASDARHADDDSDQAEA